MQLFATIKKRLNSVINKNLHGFATLQRFSYQRKCNPIYIKYIMVYIL